MHRHLVGLILCAVVSTACGLLGPRPSERSVVKQIVLDVAYVASDDHIYISGVDGANRRQVTGQISGLSSAQGWTYRWPTYSPDGKRVAFGGYRTGRPISAAVLASEVLQPKATVLLESSDMAPIYLYWSPDSRFLTALLQFSSELKLFLFDVTGAQQPRELLVGQPLYWSWAPDGKTIAVHVGGAANSGGDAWIGLLHLGAGDAQQERFTDPPGQFQAPAWSPSGAQLAYAILGGGTSLLAIRDFTKAGQVTNILSGTGNIAFNWAPSGEWLAFAYGDPALPGLYRGVEVVHPDGSGRHTLGQDHVVAFFWSPDATRLAVVGFDSSARALTWTAVSVDGKTKRPLASFVPSTDFQFQLPFFDQYSQSISVWSADSKRLVYGADTSSQTEQVLVVDADGATPGAPLAEGGAAIWSPPVAQGN